jgi:hypothetical protein
MSSLSARAPSIGDDLDSVVCPPEVSALTDGLRSARAPSHKQVDYRGERSYPTRQRNLDSPGGECRARLPAINSAHLAAQKVRHHYRGEQADNQNHQRPQQHKFRFALKEVWHVGACALTIFR